MGRNNSAELDQPDLGTDGRPSPVRGVGMATLVVTSGLLVILAFSLFGVHVDGGVAPLPTAAGPRPPAAVEAADLDRPDCPVSEILVPECGRWWGVAPAALTATPRPEALAAFEQNIDRPVDIYHAYHREDSLFPTPEELAIARDPDNGRLLLLNWKPSMTATWREIADGQVDGRIDALAAHIVQTFPERFFLTVWHEPENDVVPAAGSGMTARDYADMYRHVVTRLREAGVTNAVTVMTFMGSPQWGVTSWFPELYPGDDVVDWIGVDPYIYAVPRGRISGRFRDIVNRKSPQWPGFYSWAQAEHPDKPIMVAEWGVFHSDENPDRKAWVLRTALSDIHSFPAIKALVYFDSPNAPKGDTRIDSADDSLDAFVELGTAPEFLAPPVPRQ